MSTQINLIDSIRPNNIRINRWHQFCASFPNEPTRTQNTHVYTRSIRVLYRNANAICKQCNLEQVESITMELHESEKLYISRPRLRPRRWFLLHIIYVRLYLYVYVYGLSISLAHSFKGCVIRNERILSHFKDKFILRHDSVNL